MSSSEGSDKGSEDWVLGVTLGLLGSIAINTGNNIQSLGLKRLQSQEKVEPESDAVVVRQRTSSLPSLPWLSPAGKNHTPKRHSIPWLSPPGARLAPSYDKEDENEFVVVKVGKKSPVQSVTWVIGTIIFVSGSLLNFVSYAFAAQSMLASLESVQFVTNLLFGKFLLGAHVTQTMLAGTCLTVTGTVMAVQFSSKETYDLNTSDIKKLYHNPVYISYLILVGIFVVILHLLYGKLDERKKTVKHSDIILPCIYAVQSALFGTQSVVQAKVLAELLAVHSSGDENIFTSWFSYVTLLAWVSTVIVWLKRLNDALNRFNPLFIIPLLQCSFIFFAILSGGIFFQEFNSFDLSQWLGFCFGILVMFSGLVLLTPAPKSSKDDELHRALVNLLLESRSNISVGRTPRSPQPSPCGSTDQNNGDADPRGRRAQRLSKETVAENITNAALDAVKDMINGNPSSKALSEAMMLNTVDEGGRRRRRHALKRLLGLIKDNPISSNGYSEEITNLIQELKLDVPVVTPALAGPDIRDMAKHLNMTQERLHSQILSEIEQSNTPTPKVAPRDLTDRFVDNTRPKK